MNTIRVTFFSVLALSAYFLFSSCSNDLELFGEIVERPVVYGLLSTTANDQYIRLERSFADPETSAVVLAQDANHVYFENAQVELQDELGGRFVLQRVDAIDEGYVRRPGDFLTSPNYLYKIGSEEIGLEGGKTFRVIVIKDEEEIATASTKTLGSARFLSPGVTKRISIVAEEFTRIRWQTIPDASSYALSFDFEISEVDLGSGLTTVKKFRWDASTLISVQNVNSSDQDFLLEGNQFFQFLADNLEPQTNIERKLSKLDIRLIAFGAEIGDYLDVLNANSGITSAQEVPTYTNVIGGLGLFSSTTEILSENLVLGSKMIEELINGSITGNLSFVE